MYILYIICIYAYIYRHIVDRYLLYIYFLIVYIYIFILYIYVYLLYIYMHIVYFCGEIPFTGVTGALHTP